MATFLPHPKNKKILIYKKGKIFSRISKRYIGRKTKSGDLVVDIDTGAGMATHMVKRLVAAAFVPNPQNLPEVININHKRHDCRSVNLRWVDRLGSWAHNKKKPKPNRKGNTRPRTDDEKATASAKKRNATRSSKPESSTFILEDSHPESIF